MLTFFLSFKISLPNMKILMVCLGNICRSPIAEGIMRTKMINFKFNGIVDSAGISGMHAGESPDSRAVSVSKKYNIDISDQIARKFKASDFDQFDLILAMDQSVYAQIQSMTNDENGSIKVHLFLDFAEASPAGDVPDPWYGDQEGFERVFKMIDDGCEKIIRKIQQTS